MVSKMRQILTLGLGLFSAMLLSVMPLAAADTFQTSVRSAILIDTTTNTILFEKSADEVMAPASLTKLMTLIVVFSEIKAGRLSLDQEAVVSTDAWRRGGAPSRGSAMYLVPTAG